MFKLPIILNNLDKYIFVFLLVFSPLALGSVEIWSRTIMVVLSLAALLDFWVGNRKIKFIQTPGLVPILIFVAYILFQLTPLPAGLVEIISPSTYSFYAENGETIGWYTISMDWKATLSVFFIFVSCASFYILSVQCLSDRMRLKRTVRVMIYYIATMALVTMIIGAFTKLGILWFRDMPIEKTSIEYTPFGPYLNANHFSALLLMVFPLPAMMFFHYKAKLPGHTLRENTIHLFNSSNGRSAIYFLLSAGAIALTIFQGLSRGCIVILVLSTALIFGIAVRGKKAGIISLAALLLISGGLFVINEKADVLSAAKELRVIRNRDGKMIERRPIIWKDSMGIVSDFPLFGTGLGTFRDIYPKYTTLTVPQQNCGAEMYHALSDYVEFLVEGGIVGFLLGCWFIGTVVLKSCRAIRKRRDTIATTLFLGAAIGLGSFSLYSFFDHNLQIPANGLYYFFFLGLMVAAGKVRHRGSVVSRRGPLQAVMSDA